MGFGARRLLLHGAPFVRNNEVAPVSATARVGLTSMPKAWCGMIGREMVVLDATTVVSSSSCNDVVAVGMGLVGYGVV
jgi:hypothetical protein